MALVGRAQHQQGHPVDTADDHTVAEQDPGKGPCEAGENEPGGEREENDSEGDFDHHKHVGIGRDRIDIAVTDCRHGMHAEEEVAPEQ